jgi:uncharacterized repeat protein (TIGR03806 family)
MMADHRRLYFSADEGLPARTIDHAAQKSGLRVPLAFSLAVAFLIALPVPAIAARQGAFGMEARSASKPYLAMPDRETGVIPPLLSVVGAFKDVRHLAPSDAMVPYGLNWPFFSDDAEKTRWAVIPGGTHVGFSPKGEWAFPNGSVLVKHFDMVMDETNPSVRRRLETRILVRDAAGGVYGVTYKWRADQSDADLLATNLLENLVIRTASGVRTQTWYYPARQDCKACHTDLNHGVLGLNTRQLNGDFTYPDGVTDNQLRTWEHLGLFDGPLQTPLESLSALATWSDTNRSKEDRARSYLDANCAHCHRPGGTPGFFDARYDTPLEDQGLLNGNVLIDQGIDHPHVITPHDPWRSIAYMRVSNLDSIRMPPLGHDRLDKRGVDTLSAWIDTLPGNPVLPPPLISGTPLDKGAVVEVTISHSTPAAVIRYTLDGSAPGSTDPVYEKPLRLDAATVVRARAFKPGFKKSIPVQQIFEMRN